MAFLTPAVTVTTAIEGLRGFRHFLNVFGNDQTIIVVITLTIIFNSFSVQRFGTELVREKLFGPIMFLWFTFFRHHWFNEFLAKIGRLFVH